MVKSFGLAKARKSATLKFLLLLLLILQNFFHHYQPQTIQTDQVTVMYCS